MCCALHGSDIPGEKWRNGEIRMRRDFLEFHFEDLEEKRNANGIIFFEGSEC